MPDKVTHQTDALAKNGVDAKKVAARADEELSVEELEGVSGGGGKSSAPGSSHTYHNSYSGSSSNKS